MRRPGSRPTGRGIALLLLGVGLGLVGWNARQPVLLWPGIFLATLPVFAFIGVLADRPALTVQRTLAPSEPVADEQLVVTLHVHQRRPSVAGKLAVLDVLPATFGLGSTLALTLGGAGRWASASYQCAPGRRGRYPLDDLRYRVQDALGLSQRTVRALGTTEVVVTPALARLTDLQQDRLGDSGEVPLPRLAFGGPDDVFVREHQPLDDMRRVHWPATARTGTLMVRREEHVIDPVATVLLDTRRLPARDADARFEWLVSLAAAVGVHLVERGFGVRLVTSSGRRLVWPVTGTIGSREWLLSLVDVAAEDVHHLDVGLREVGRGASDQLLVVLLGHLDAAATEALGGFGDRRTQTVAWCVPDDDPEFAQRSARLAKEGWQVVPTPPRRGGRP